MLIGNLGSDPELRYTQSGQPVANFSIATSESYKDNEGNLVEKTEWHKIVVWGKLAEICKQYLKKGRQVYIEGKLQTRSWEDAEQKKHYSTEVVCADMQMLGNREGGSSNGSYADESASSDYERPSRPKPAMTAAPKPKPIEAKAVEATAATADPKKDDLPF